MGKFKDTLCRDTPPIPTDATLHEIHLFDLSEYELPGQILVTILSDKVSIAYKGRQSERWSAPSTAKRLLP